MNNTRRGIITAAAAAIPASVLAHRTEQCQPDIGAQQACEQFVMFASTEARCQGIDPIQYTLTMLGTVMRQS